MRNAVAKIAAKTFGFCVDIVLGGRAHVDSPPPEFVPPYRHAAPPYLGGHSVPGPGSDSHSVIAPVLPPLPQKDASGVPHSPPAAHVEVDVVDHRHCRGCVCKEIFR